MLTAAAVSPVVALASLPHHHISIISHASAVLHVCCSFFEVVLVLYNPGCLLQVMNEINARRINDELNVFEDLHKSPIFLAVIVITIGLQVIIIQTPVSNFFKIAPLNGPEWGVSIAIGLGAVPVSIATRLITR